MSIPPHIVFAPGAGHVPEHYERLISVLTAAPYSYNVTVTNNLMCMAEDPNTATVAACVEEVRSSLVPLIEEQGQDVLLVAHSWGGIVGGEAAWGMTKKERQAKGEKGGVIGVVLLAGLYLTEGQKVLVAFGGTLPPWMKLDEQAGLLNIETPDAINLFYHDVAADIAAKAVSMIRPASYVAHITPASGRSILPIPSPDAEDVLAGKRLYIKTTQDHCIPPFAQDHLIEVMNGAAGKGWQVRELESSHSPFLTEKNGELVEIIDTAARKFSADQSWV